MILDGLTVLFDTTLMATTVGAFLIFAGLQRNGDRSLCLWGAGYIAAAIATILFMQRGRIDNVWTIDVANAFFNLAYGLFFAAARLFGGRRTPAAVVLAGSVLWLALCRIDVFYASTVTRVVVSSLMVTAYLLATCWALWQIPERLPSKKPLIGIIALHALVFIARLPGVILTPPPSGSNIVVTPMFFIIAVEGLFHLVATSVLLVTMSKERSENGVQLLASTDPLTGISNRRAFLEHGARGLADAAVRRQPVSVLMLDIDHFKSINDTRGHGGGDEVLQRFGELLREVVRPTDVCGRLGGEEFGCVLFNCDEGNGGAVAERLRVAVAERQPGVTVSVGVASVPGTATSSLAALMAAADRALYASKDFGRNRVTLAEAA